jgi:hypothetical protein
MALVAVLGVLAVVGLMVAHLAVLGEVTQRESVVAVERSRLKYVAESTAGEALWSYLVDRKLFANRALGREDITREGSTWEEPWMLDGREHSPDAETQVRVALLDATRGIDVSGKSPASELGDHLDDDLGDADDNERVRAFLSLAADYVDSNDLRREPYGKERADYEDEGFWDFPRDGELMFREEVYWLDGWQDVLRGSVQLIPPKGIRGVKVSNRRKPFFSSSPALIKALLRLDNSELSQVLEARRAWRQELVPLDDSLDADLLARVRAAFSFAESGLATIEVLAESHIAGISRKMRLTLNCDLRKADSYSDTGRQALAIWERRFY